MLAIIIKWVALYVKEKQETRGGDKREEDYHQIIIQARELSSTTPYIKETVPNMMLHHFFSDK